MTKINKEMINKINEPSKILGGTNKIMMYGKKLIKTSQGRD